ncbi:hypothetical protein [Saccharomonospora halophila]|uniref:hypothetical protein n=1 Tax=Saccharomonospora halophila TaxID=129922 RepID=UPI0003A11F97|nr:hypothetical protein [Saccharomonospora halophila]
MVDEHRTPQTEPERVFPIPRPASGNDPRFTLGLLLDVKQVLVQHGYPMDQATGPDHLALKQALFRFLYASTDGGER